MTHINNTFSYTYKQYMTKIDTKITLFPQFPTFVPIPASSSTAVNLCTIT